MESNEHIIITYNKKTYKFDIGTYLHHDGERCKYKVFHDGKLVATFAPDKNHLLQLCKNHGNLREPLLHLVADQIEALHPYGFQ
jgi:hypothetical protein